ncbi:MAG: glycosyltransferase family 2 protein [Candidatus Dormibacteria bacterium]
MSDGVWAVVLNYQTGDLAARCILSLEAQSGPSPMVVVVDNASADGSGAALARRFPQHRHLQAGANLGYAGGNNLGIRAALEGGAAAIMVVNPDVELEPGCLEALAPALRLGRVAGPVSYQPGPGWTVDLLTLRLDPVDAEVSAPRRGDQVDPGTLGGELPTDYVTGSAVAAPAAAWRATGGFHEGYFLTWEDTEFSVRASRHGHQPVVVGAAHCRHLGSASFDGQWSPLYRYYHTRNHLLFLRRNRRGLARLRGLRRALRAHRIERDWFRAQGSGAAEAQARAAERALRDFWLGRQGPLRGGL